MTRFASEALARHERADFCSGHDRIDRYFGETVSQDVKRSYAACFVLIERSSGKVVGFYTLSYYNIPLNDVNQELAKKLPRYPSIPGANRGLRDLYRYYQRGRHCLLHEASVSTAGESSADAVPADEDSPGLGRHLGPSAPALALDQRLRTKGKVAFHRSESASGG